MPKNNFPGPPSANIGPHVKAVAVVPSGLELAELPRALWVGGAGILALRFGGSDTIVLIKGIAAGSYLQMRPTHILPAADGTTATDIVALY